MANEITSGLLSSALNDKMINEAFEIVRSTRNGIMQVVGMSDPMASYDGYKMGWLDWRVDAQSSLLNGAINNSVTTVNVDDGTRFRVGMTVSVEGSDEVMLVTAISSNALTVTRGFGGTTAAAAADNARLLVDSVAREENSLAANDNIIQPVDRENYFQTMDTAIEMSRRALSTLQFGNTNDLQVQLQERLRQLAIQMNRAVIRGRKATATVGGSQRTFTGGMNYWVSQTGGINTDNSNNALTLTHLDNLSAEVVSRGGDTNTIAVSIATARKLQALINANYQSQRLAENISDRDGLTMLSSDLPIIGNVNRIVVDTNINDNELYMFDSGMISVKPMAAGNANASGAWRTLDATQPGQDGESARIIGDFAVEVKNSQTNVARLHNFA